MTRITRIAKGVLDAWLPTRATQTQARTIPEPEAQAEGLFRSVLFSVPLCLWSLCALPSFAHAQEVTVEQLVTIALESSPELRAARADFAVAAGQIIQAGLRPNPVAVSSQEQGRGGMMTTIAGVEWPLDLFRRSARTEAARRSSDVTSLTVRDRERLLAAAVREQAGRLLAARRILEVTNEALAEARRTRDLVARQVSEGRAPALDANLASLEALRVEADAALATGEAEAAIIELKALAGLPPDAVLVVRDSLESLVLSASVPRLTPAAAMETRPDIREALARMTFADARAEDARRSGGFDMTMVGGYTRARSGYAQQGFDARGVRVPIEGVFHTVMVGAKVTLPLFHRNQGALASAQAERGAAEALFDARQRAARAEIDAAGARDREARRAVELYASTVRDLARQNVTVVLEAYDLGRFRLSDVLAEQRRYLDVEASYTDVLSRAYQAQAAVRRALGEIP
jgi:cobalt-zinc-cadmium efflux system outer membrane protein